jgi:hypothetical protein
LSHLPVLKSLHANTRFASAFILPLSILGGGIFSSWLAKAKSSWKGNLAFLSCNLLALLSLLGYLLLPMDVQARDFEVPIILETYQGISEGNTYPVDQVIPDMNDYEVFILHSSNIGHHYEPLFGNSNEYFTPLLHEGSAFDVENGFLNFTDPTGYVFPQENGTTMYSRFPVSERQELQDFLARKQPDSKLPLVQRILNWMAALSFSAVLLMLVISPLFQLPVAKKLRDKVPFIRRFL